MRLIASCLLVFLGVLCGQVPAPAMARMAPAGFDYYLLSLSLSPSFCALSPRNQSTQECRSLDPQSFAQMPLTAHGLWPNRTGVSVNRQPQFCDGPQFHLSQDVRSALREVMPGGEGLARHEWQRHGTCSGLSPDDYFATLVRLTRHANLTVGQALRDTGALGHTLQIGTLLNTIRAHDPNLASAIVVSCRTPRGGGPPLVSEIRIILSKDLAPMPASEAQFGQNSGCPRGEGRVPDAE
jgi:ribonuclease T2